MIEREASVDLKTHPTSYPSNGARIELLNFDRFCPQSLDFQVIFTSRPSSFLQLFLSSDFKIANVVQCGQCLVEPDILQLEGEGFSDKV